MQPKTPRRLTSIPVLAILLIIAIVVGCWFLLAALLQIASADVESKIATAGIGAFLGAFFAFLFLRLGTALTKYYERQAKHHAALVHAEYQLNLLYSDIDDARYLGRLFLDTISPPVKDGAMRLSAHRFDQLELDRGILPDLLNLDLINDLLIMFDHLRKLNKSLAALNRIYDGILETTTTGKPDAVAYAENASRVAIDLRSTLKFMDDASEEVLRNLARVRVLTRAIPLLARITMLLSKRSYPRRFGAALEAELAVVRDELASSEAESTIRLSRILRDRDDRFQGG